MVSSVTYIPPNTHIQYLHVETFGCKVFFQRFFLPFLIFNYFWKRLHCWKSVQILSVSGPYFHVFGLNTEIYFVNIRIQSKYVKIRTRKTLYLDTFHPVLHLHCLIGFSIRVCSITERQRHFHFSRSIVCNCKE